MPGRAWRDGSLTLHSSQYGHHHPNHNRSKEKLPTKQSDTHPTPWKNKVFLSFFIFGWNCSQIMVIIIDFHCYLILCCRLRCHSRSLFQVFVTRKCNVIVPPNTNNISLFNISPFQYISFSIYPLFNISPFQYIPFSIHPFFNISLFQYIPF